MVVLNKIKEVFPGCRRVNVYGRASDVLRKTPQELRQLYENGVRMVYIGAESGSDRILKKIQKGETAAELIRAVHMIEESGIKASVTFISGIAGKEEWKEHAVETGRMISEMNASYVALLACGDTPSPCGSCPVPSPRGGSARPPRCWGSTSSRARAALHGPGGGSGPNGRTASCSWGGT